MSLNQTAKNQFINGMVADFESDLPGEIKGDVRKKILDGQRKYAEKLCNRIVTLIKQGRITDVQSGDSTRSIT